jgi:hypothetical protein
VFKDGQLNISSIDREDSSIDLRVDLGRDVEQHHSLFQMTSQEQLSQNNCSDLFTAS